MWVVKIGGSLQDSSYLREWLDSLIRNGSGKVIIVPGGGKFADAVRQSQSSLGFDDACAHKMALLAMEQTAYMLTGLAPELELAADIKSIRDCLARKKITVWLPYKMVVGQSEIPASWEVTADGLAAWLALQLRIRSLILVKSRALPVPDCTYEELVSRGLIDPFLGRLLRTSDLNVSWLQKDESGLLVSLFQNMQPFQVCKLSTRQISRLV